MSYSRHRFVRSDLNTRLIGPDNNKTTAPSGVTYTTNGHKNALGLTLALDVLGIWRGIHVPLVSDTMGSVAKALAFVAAGMHLIRLGLSAALYQRHENTTDPVIPKSITVPHCIATISAIVCILVETGTQITADQTGAIEYASTAVFQNVYAPACMLYLYMIVF
jgi:hypothetical protein